MDRREFAKLALAAPVAFLAPDAALAYRAVEYAPGVLAQAWSGNMPVVVNYNASWSMTCQIKRAIIAQLKSENPAYLQGLLFVDIDWDTYGRSQLAERMMVERRSTLVAFKGETEVGRLVAETNPDRIRMFLDDALAA